MFLPLKLRHFKSEQEQKSSTPAWKTWAFSVCSHGSRRPQRQIMKSTFPVFKYFMNNTLPIGELIREKLIEERRSAIWLAEKLCCHRSTVHKILNKSLIDTELLLRISLVLDFNFFNYYTNIFNENQTKQSWTFSTQTICRQIGNKLFRFSAQGTIKYVIISPYICKKCNYILNW